MIVQTCSQRRCVTTALLSFLSVPAVWATPAGLPNIVLCMGDDHGWEETGYNGHPHLQTPVLDEMAAEGLRLDHFYAAHPTCSPTRGSVLTGRHPNRYGTFTPNFSTRPEEITIAQLLKEAGYGCGHFGKWHVGPVKKSSPTSPGALGFDEWLSHDNFFELNPFLSRNGESPQRFAGESSQIVVDEALKFMARVQREGRPFLVVIWFGSPHEPYSGLPEDLALYDDLPQAYLSKTVALTSNQTGLRVERPQRDVLRERYAEITAMDRAIGALRNFLRDTGLRNNTLLWYCGDNGTPSEGLVASPFRGQKGQLYEGGIRVPGIIEWPQRITAHASSKLNAVTSDILPTLCAVTGQPLPDRPLDGISLEPVFDGNQLNRPGPLYFWKYDAGLPRRNGYKPYIDLELQKGTTPLVKLMGGIATRNFQNFRHPKIEAADYRGPRAVLDANYKLILREGSSGTLVRELFDLEDDPAESKNLIKSKPHVVARMERQLRGWQDSVLNSLTGADYR